MTENPSLTTSDLDETRSALSHHFYTMTVDRLEPAAQLDTRMDIVQIGSVTIGDLGFGADLRFGLGELGAYHVDVLLSGRMHWRQAGDQPRIATCSAAAIFQPAGDVMLDRLTGDGRVLAVKIAPAALENRLARMLDAPVRGTIRFEPELDTAGGPGRTWVELVQLLCADAAGLTRHPLLAAGTEDNLLGALLLAAHHQYRDRLDHRTATPAVPRAVRRAMDLIRSHPEQPLTVTELAFAAGCSERSLQKGFQRYAGVSPMAYLRQVRLERVHEELTDADAAAVTVTEVAARWGFTHQGRFAGAYRRRYGVTPSKTLRG